VPGPQLFVSFVVVAAIRCSEPYFFDAVRHLPVAVFVLCVIKNSWFVSGLLSYFPLARRGKQVDVLFFRSSRVLFGRLTFAIFIVNKFIFTVADEGRENY
jgi:hypothetical protein